MNSILLSIDEEKRDKILNSCFEEFGKNDFDKASTNVIVEGAGISKGLLFHYFGNKKKLYDILCTFSFEYVYNFINDNIDWAISDFFERVEHIASIKIQILKKYPHIYNFMKRATKSKELSEIKDGLFKESGILLKKIFTQGIDYSLFRSDVDIKKAIEIIQWTEEGAYIKLWQNNSNDQNVEEIIEEIKQYMVILKTIFYK